MRSKEKEYETSVANMLLVNIVKISKLNTSKFLKLTF